jgi:hypothetical protein
LRPQHGPQREKHCDEAVAAGEAHGNGSDER